MNNYKDWQQHCRTTTKYGQPPVKEFGPRPHLYYDYFYFQLNEHDKGEVACRICETHCQVDRKGYNQPLGRGSIFYDVWHCPYLFEPWHQRGFHLFLEIEKTFSDGIAAIIQSDLDKIIADNIVGGDHV